MAHTYFPVFWQAKGLLKFKGFILQNTYSFNHSVEPVLEVVELKLCGAAGYMCK